jgi:hypothetical protein
MNKIGVKSTLSGPFKALEYLTKYRNGGRLSPSVENKILVNALREKACGARILIAKVSQ